MTGVRGRSYAGRQQSYAGMRALKSVFVPRVEDPQIVVEELFWLGTEPAEVPPTEE
ncbi:hypothetical protein ACF1DV_29415 [Streptomyces achromogenes]|uniref:hypothetical protein n=1 Tax=Streptomyces achromogenes TaxID=67255 RepID=UPI0036F715FB